MGWIGVVQLPFSFPAHTIPHIVAHLLPIGNLAWAVPNRDFPMAKTGPGWIGVVLTQIPYPLIVGHSRVVILLLRRYDIAGSDKNGTNDGTQRW